MPISFRVTIADEGGATIEPILEELEQRRPAPATDEDIKTPRWEYWRQRRLANVWFATLISMNIEPSSRARAALKAHHPERYQTYKDRVDIATTLMGYELMGYEDHAREGTRASEKYVELTDYYDFAVSKGWSELDSMKVGLGIENQKPEPLTNMRMENNILRFLQQIFLSIIKDYPALKKGEKLAAVKMWISELDIPLSVTDDTLRNWIQRMDSLVLDQKAKADLDSA